MMMTTMSRITTTVPTPMYMFWLLFLDVGFVAGTVARAQFVMRIAQSDDEGARRRHLADDERVTPPYRVRGRAE